MSFIELASGTVIQRSDLEKFTTEKLTEFLTGISNSGRKITVIDNYHQFFSKKNFSNAVEKADLSTVKLIAEKMNVQLTQDELDELQRVCSWKEAFLAKFVEPSISKDYPFAVIPKDWDIDENITFSRTNMTRVGCGYTIGYKTAEKIWNFAKKKWAEWPASSISHSMNSMTIGQYSKTPTIYKTKVGIGCQQIERYELEQVALRLGWNFTDAD